VIPRLRRGDDGGLRFEGLAPWHVGILVEVPALLDPDQPEDVRRRLYPTPSDDEERNAEWRKLVHPELFALVASAREIVSRDLAGLEPDPEVPEPPTWRLAIPAEHLRAWLGALNSARLTLGCRHGITEKDMDGTAEDEIEGAADDEVDDAAGPDTEIWGEKEIAVVKIHVLAELQQLLIEEMGEG
jgi:hypothetical protein